MQFTFKKLAVVMTTLWCATEISAQAFNIADYFKSGTYYQGTYQLKEDADTASSLGLDRSVPGYEPENRFKHLFTTTFRMTKPDNTTFDAWVPDLLYKVRPGDTDASLGLRLIPVSYEDTSAAGAKLIDAFMRKLFWGNPDEPSEYYSIVAHTESNKDYYEDAKSLVADKGEFSVFHSSTNYGDNRYSRHGFSNAGTPKNVFAVTLKGTPQLAFNLNAMIWAKLYYENPAEPGIAGDQGGYEFAENYHQDPVTNINLQEVLAFATGWLDRTWVRADLNAKVIDVIAQQRSNKRFNQATTYYTLLQTEPTFYLYCFEGVVHTLNMGLNIPLTEEYFKRIWGAEWGAKLFAKANDRWIQVQKSEEIPDSGLQSLTDLKPILSQVTPLWVKDLSNPERFTESSPLFVNRASNGTPQLTAFDPRGQRIFTDAAADGLRDNETQELGRSLAVTPQTTGDILKDFITIYAPFHKVGGVRSAAMMLGFQKTVIDRTGIAPAKFMQVASNVISVMFKHDAALTRTRFTDEQAVAGMAQYKAAVQAGFHAIFRTPNDNDAPNQGDQLFTSAVAPSIDAPAPLTVSAAEPAGLTAWKNFVAEATPIMVASNQTPIAQPDLIVQTVMRHARPTRTGYLVKYNVSPGILTSIATGTYPTNPDVLFTNVATVIDEAYAEQKPNEADRVDTGLDEMTAKMHDFAGVDLVPPPPRERGLRSRRP